MGFADWKKRSEVCANVLTYSVPTRSNILRAMQAAYKAGERDGRKQVESIAENGAKLAVLVEREACARVCDEMEYPITAAFIRKRSNVEVSGLARLYAQGPLEAIVRRHGLKEMTVDDKELTELAAKAAGVQIRYNSIGTQDARCPWKPLEDDGTALSLAGKLKVNIEWRDDSVLVGVDGWPCSYMREYFAENSDTGEAARRAIVRAAAEIGKGVVTPNAEVSGRAA